jgi:phosphatidylglycerophosphate synthase
MLRLIPLNPPNLVTLLRILLIPLIVGVFYLPDAWLSFEGKNIAATAIFIVAAITDWLDGYLARKLN